MSKIYVASSWRNTYYPEVVARLRKEGHEVYDFRNPKPGDNGFKWSQIDPLWQSWTPADYREALKHPLAQAGFQSDFGAMKWCDDLCLVLPSGRSAHIEAGWAIGQGKGVSIYLPEPVEPELMYLTENDDEDAVTKICVSLDEVIEFHSYGLIKSTPERAS